MAYEKQVWKNKGEEGAIAINKTRLNHIEDGISEAYPVQLIAVAEVEPSTCSIGDKYYNTSAKLIYTAIADNVWSSDGETPKSDIAYWVLSQNGNFGWDGTDLVSIGGGKPQVVVSDTEPSGQPTLWIDTTEISGAKSEVVNSMSGNETALAPSVKAVADFTRGDVLYSNTTGTNGTINLNGDLSQYRYFDISFYWNHWQGNLYNTQRIKVVVGSRISIGIVGGYYDSNSIYSVYGYYSLSNNSINKLSMTSTGMGSQPYVNPGSNVYVVEVIGYK